ncbi:HD domain-containing protein [Mycoplasmatota bacterium WC30]
MIDRDQIIKIAKEYVFEQLNKDVSGHDYYHIMRVYNMAIKLAKNYTVNLFVISLAALLHDLDDYKITDEASNKVDTFLKKYQVKETAEIVEIINNMSFSSYKLGKSVKSLEGKIVQDADRLDAIGAIGIARCFAYSGTKNRAMYKNDKNDDSSIAHFYQKLLKLPNLMNTTEAKEIAEKRVDFMKQYLKNFFEEWELSE